MPTTQMLTRKMLTRHMLPRHMLTRQGQQNAPGYDVITPVCTRYDTVEWHVHYCCIQQYAYQVPGVWPHARLLGWSRRVCLRVGHDDVDRQLWSCFVWYAPTHVQLLVRVSLAILNTSDRRPHRSWSRSPRADPIGYDLDHPRQIDQIDHDVDHLGQIR